MDGRPNRRNKDAFSNFPGVARGRGLTSTLNDFGDQPAR